MRGKVLKLAYDFEKVLGIAEFLDSPDPWERTVSSVTVKDLANVLNQKLRDEPHLMLDVLKNIFATGLIAKANLPEKMRRVKMIWNHLPLSFTVQYGGNEFVDQAFGETLCEDVHDS